MKAIVGIFKGRASFKQLSHYNTKWNNRIVIMPTKVSIIVTLFYWFLNYRFVAMKPPRGTRKQNHAARILLALLIPPILKL